MLVVSFYVFWAAPRNLLNQLFGAMASGIALFLFLIFRQVRAASLDAPPGLLMDAAKAVYIVDIVLTILFLAVLVERRRTVTKSLRKSVYHKGFVTLGVLFLAYGGMIRFPMEAPEPGVDWIGVSGVVSMVLGGYFFGKVVLHFGMFRISLHNTAEKIVAEMDEALFLLSPELRVVWCNPAAESLMSQPLQNLSGRFIDALLISEDGRSKAHWFGNEPKEGKVKNGDGEIVPVSINSATLKNRRGVTIGYVVVVRNLSMRTRRIEEIRRHRDELEELVNQRTRELNNSHLSLKKSKVQLSYLNKILMEVKEQESMHIARELNNKIVPALTEIRNQASAFSTYTRPSLPDFDYGLGKSEKIASLAAAAIESVTRISAGLPPPDLESGDLVAALSGLIADFRARSGISCVFNHEVGDGLEPVKEDMSIVVYRIVQESLTNAARHAGGDRIEVTLKREGAFITIAVKDNGKGMALRDMDTLISTGLRGMKERAKGVRGTLDIRSAPGRGTTVSFEADLRPPAVRI